MRDISHKINTRRTARAKAVLEMSCSSVNLVRSNTGPKKDILPTAKAAAYLAVKNTANVIPHCHPMPVEHVDVSFEFSETEITIFVDVITTYKTGCEIEAMHGAQIAALTVYDMLKPVDKEITITNTVLCKKTGGKSDFQKIKTDVKTAVLVISDSVSAGKKDDSAGKAAMAALEKIGINELSYHIIPDEKDAIEKQINALKENGVELIISTGGTGLSPRDITPETIRPLLDREIDGIMEAARKHGQDRTPYAMLSRGIAGFSGKTLIITLPGSTRGVIESMEAIFPHVLHIFKVLDKTYTH